ncbi:MAG: hypothetical protein U9R29_11375 [Thermodesulfobacteriota bacterium]|nr:hypothetical protein [Thermodesulfobacteriota bacterium]
MNTASRNSFLQQISQWASEYIAQGRSPFRKAELGSPLITSKGEQAPDLVFWINQDSLVAGGFVLFPDSEEFDLDTAQSCAHALGISYFASWTTQKITFWRVDDLSIHKQICSPSVGVDSFEDALIQLMDKFRTLAVLGACPPDKFSYWHLTNLCLRVHNRALPTLSEHLRRDQNRHKKHLAPLEIHAKDKLLISVARLLTLLYYDKIPYNIQPEKLDLALRYLAGELPRQPFACLKACEDEPELDEHSAVLFHHLLRRLDQIAIFNNKERAGQLLKQLLIHSALCHTTEHMPGSACADISIYCNHVSNTATQLIEIDQPARLAMKHLLRKLMDWPTGQQHESDIFSLKATQQTTPPEDQIGEQTGEHQKTQTVEACLFNMATLDTHYRNNYHTRLKLVWPGRVFNFHQSTPTWAYEFCYLLGVMAPQSQLNAYLPANILSSPFSHVIIKLLLDQFTLYKISRHTPYIIHITAIKDQDDTAQVQLQGERLRTLAWKDLRHAEPEWLALALSLSDTLYQLLEQGVVHFDASNSTAHPQGLANYLNSTLAQSYLHYLQPKINRFKRSKWQPRIPAPSNIILKALSALEINDLSEAARLATIDAELERLLDIEIATVSPTPTLLTSHNSHQDAKVDKKRLRATIVNLVKVHGLPEFPTHYLYEFFHPALSLYDRGNTPWEISEEFMGTYQLIMTHRGKTEKLSIHNEFLAHAIVLASHGQAQILLPDDVTICTTIVTRYLNDLDEIHGIIWRECHATLHQRADANRQVGKTWKSLSLPPWDIVEKFLKRFQINP